MTTNQHPRPGQYVAQCRTALQTARDSGDRPRICQSLVALGAALFAVRKYEEGMAAFDEALELAAVVADPRLIARCLEVKKQALQDAGRMPEAFEAVKAILELAAVHDDPGMECDAITSQAQILINTGEPIIALQRLKEARELAADLPDKHHLMRVMEGFANLNLSMATPDQAVAYFDRAGQIAQELAEAEAVIHYLLSKGTVLIWQRKYADALPVLEQTLTRAQAFDDRVSMLTCWRCITQCQGELEQHDRVLDSARQGLTLARQMGDHDAVFAFYEALALTHYHLNQVAEAQTILAGALDYAQEANKPQKALDVMLNLGESYMLSGTLDRALATYRQALDKVRKRQRMSDAAYLVGRIGVVLGEMGQVSEALDHHRQAVELARQHHLPELEGEQLCMLALALLDQEQPAEARTHCDRAIAVYDAAGLEDEAAHARRLLAEIDARRETSALEG